MFRLFYFHRCYAYGLFLFRIVYYFGYFTFGIVVFVHRSNEIFSVFGHGIRGFGRNFHESCFLFIAVAAINCVVAFLYCVPCEIAYIKYTHISRCRRFHFGIFSVERHEGFPGIAVFDYGIDVAAVCNHVSHSVKHIARNL